MFDLLVTAATPDYVDVWDRVSYCESREQWDINTGNTFYGGVQFTQDSWEGVGGLEFAPRADLASRDEQIAAARRLLALQGPGAWPLCSIDAGLTMSNGRADINAMPGGAQPVEEHYTPVEGEPAPVTVTPEPAESVPEYSAPAEPDVQPSVAPPAKPVKAPLTDVKVLFGICIPMTLLIPAEDG